MKDWRESYLSLCAEARSEVQLFKELAKIVENLGFQYCSYGLRVPLPVANPTFHLFTNYPSRWEERYIANNYFGIDPTVKHGMSEVSPLTWAADQARDQQDFWEEARQHDLRHGWCLSSFGHFGTGGLLSLVRSADQITTKELDAKEAKLIWLTKLVHSSMARFLAPKMMPECLAELTFREKEALKWTAVGKTYIEVGMILGIDERTVKFHLVNAMRKLNAANKAEAAVKASLLGMLF
ncbi:LuxR family transcriptional regulator [Pseudomonas duriflava]|uniref:LuxR family transcriptional regulator n=1 Tax=Pseudomonas duriflava TaxID=459528 RepID=A0A562QCE3_9PSED|nr:autoinducer binding domain-containing protein [Pseudomonas duriflava]TWI53696.1 LuxR family transcriptional regulator [Pseudomonas duriflava]